MRVSFTRTGHVLNPLGSPDYNYLICIAKIQCSSLFLATDANLKRMYLYDARRPYAPILDELAGYHRNDLSIASVDLLDPGDGTDAICGDVCVDDSGHYIYALVIKHSDAYIKVFKNIDRVLSYQDQHYRLPKSDVPYTIYRKTPLPLLTLPMQHCLGRPVLDSQFCYGTGLAYHNGVLYALTRRETVVDVMTSVRYDAVVKPNRVNLRDDEINPGPFVPGTEELRSPSATYDGKMFHLRLAEKRTATVRFNLLTTIHAETGEFIGNTRLTQPAIVGDETGDALLHGLSIYDGKLWVGARWDRDVLPADLTFWHLSEGKSHIPNSAPTFDYGYDTTQNEDGSTTYSNGWVSCQVAGFANYEAAVYPDGENVRIAAGNMHATDRTACSAVYYSIMKLAKSHGANAVNQITPIEQTRGQTAIIAYDLEDLKDSNETLPEYEVISDVFPFGVALPYSMTHDQAERKFYCAFGNQAWVFDCLDYTLLVNYPDHPTLFAGEIIDLSNVLDANRQETQCFFRNDAKFTMYNVTLTIEVTDADLRSEDLFLFIPPEKEGFKTITLGDITPGESREFWLRIYSLQVQFFEDKTTHILPLRIYYDVHHDDF